MDWTRFGIGAGIGAGLASAAAALCLSLLPREFVVPDAVQSRVSAVPTETMDAPPAAVPRPRAHVEEEPPPEVEFEKPVEESPRPVVRFAPGEVPRELLGEGPGILEIRAHSPASTEPVRCGARLWRMGLPAEGDWSAGDQIQAELWIRDGAARVVGLPPGRYRVDVPYQRLGAADPPEFEIGAEPVTKLMELDMPREVPILLRLFGHDGVELHEAEVQRPGGCSSSRSTALPGWASPRRLMGARERRQLGVGVGHRIDRTWTYRAASPDGLLLGRERQASRQSSVRMRYSVRVAGRNLVRPTLETKRWVGDGPFTYVAPCVPLEILAQHVVTPTGQLAVVAGARVDATCDASLVADGVDAEAWRSVPITVTVVLEGFQPLSFEWRANQSVEQRVLVASGS